MSENNETKNDSSCHPQFNAVRFPEPMAYYELMKVNASFAYFTLFTMLLGIVFGILGASVCLGLGFATVWLGSYFLTLPFWSSFAFASIYLILACYTVAVLFHRFVDNAKELVSITFDVDPIGRGK